MKNRLSEIKKIKECLEDASFLVSKGNSEREAHGKILECLVLVAQLENVIEKFTPIPLPSDRDEKIPKTHHNTRHSALFNTNDKQQVEIEKVTRRLPKWFRNQSQNNSNILITFLNLSEKNENVHIQQLKDECNSIKDFYGNYNQMKNFGEKNHGKVFEEKDGIITLWEPVKDLILRLYNENCIQ